GLFAVGLPRGAHGGAERPRRESVALAPLAPERLRLSAHPPVAVCGEPHAHPPGERDRGPRDDPHALSRVRSSRVAGSARPRGWTPTPHRRAAHFVTLARITGSFVGASTEADASGVTNTSNCFSGVFVSSLPFRSASTASAPRFC